MDKKCEGCPHKESAPEQKIPPKQLKMLMERQKKIQEIQKALLKDIEPLQKRTVALFKTMKKCEECKESKYKFVPCEKHYALLKELAEETNDIRTYYSLKQQLVKIK